MKDGWKIVGLVLLLAITLGTLTIQSPFMLSAREKPSGCHEHGRPSSAPVPDDSYRCCIAGHDSAIVQPSAVPQALIHTSPNLLVAAEIWSHEYLVWLRIDYSSLVSPPGTIPLRI